MFCIYFSFLTVVFLITLNLPADLLLKPQNLLISRQQGQKLSGHGKGCPVFPGSYETMDFAFDLSGQNLKFPGSLSGFFPLSLHLSIQPQQIMFHDTGQSRQQFLDFPDCVYSLVILLLLCHLQEISYDVCAAVLLR